MMNIYHKLKVSYIIKHVIIKHALVKELLILQVQNDDIKPWKKCTFKYYSTYIFILYLEAIRCKANMDQVEETTFHDVDAEKI
jgi:hypothetical protein